MSVSYKKFSKKVKDIMKGFSSDVLNMKPDSFEKAYAHIQEIYSDFIKECHQNTSNLIDFANGVKLGCHLSMMLTTKSINEYILLNMKENDGDETV